MASVDWTSLRAVLFDLDGVLTPTAQVHAAAWKRTFDRFLETHHGGKPYRPFDQEDYRTTVDGKRRYDGVRAFLVSRGIWLEDGDPADAPGFDSVCALGNTKNVEFNRVLSDEGVEPYPDAVAFLDMLEGRSMMVAVVSSSANARAVLAAAGLTDRFSVVVDGTDARDRGLTGKPAPDTFLAAARDLGVEPVRGVVVEDALSGVAAGRAGGFGLVVGVAREGGQAELAAAGADLVVDDLTALAL